MISRLPIFLLAFVAIACAGCGGDDGDTASSSATTAGSAASDEGETVEGDSSAPGVDVETSDISKEEFIEGAEAICQEGSEQLLGRLGAYMSRNANSSKPREVVAAEAVKQAVLPGVEEQIEGIEELGAPEGDEEQIEAFLTAQRRSVESLRERRTLSLETDLDPSFREAGKLARQYGLQSCAYG